MQLLILRKPELPVRQYIFCIRDKMRSLIINVIYIFLISLVLFCKSSESAKKESTVSKTIHEFRGDEVIPLTYKSIYIHNFDDRSYKADIIGRLKQRLQVEFQTEGRLNVKSDKEQSDLWLYGSIEQFREVPRSFDNFGLPTTFQVTIIVRLKVRINPNSQAYKAQLAVRKIQARELDGVLLDRRYVRMDITYSSRLPPFETQFSAHQRLISNLAVRIRKTVLDGWYSDLKTDIELGYNPQNSINQEKLERVIQKDIPKEKREEILKQNKMIRDHQENPSSIEFKTPDEIEKEKN